MSAPVVIAVVSWNTRDLLRPCLASLSDDVAEGRATVTVHDNASGDGSAEMVRHDFPWAGLIASPQNLGFGTAVNAVAEHTDTPWIMAANADTTFERGALASLLGVGSARPDVGIVAPRLIADDGGTQHSVHPFPRLGVTAAFNLGLPQLARPLADRLLLEGYWNPERARYVDWAEGACLLIRRSAWDEVGGFDPQQWMYAEDLDLGWRAGRAGWRTWYEPGARIRHVGAASTAQAWGSASRERWLRSTYGWMARRRGMGATRAYAAINTAGALARALPPLPGRRADPAAQQRRAEMRAWARLHGTALLTSTAKLKRYS